MTPMPVDIPLQALPHRLNLLVDKLLSPPNYTTHRANRTSPQASTHNRGAPSSRNRAGDSGLHQDPYNIPFGLYKPQLRHTGARTIHQYPPCHSVRRL